MIGHAIHNKRLPLILTNQNDSVTERYTMVFDTPGKITDRIWLVGRRESCAYLVGGGNEYALLGGAMAYVAPDVLEQVNAFGIDEQNIRRIVILHSHFDHCGMVPFLKRRWPWATVTASQKSQDLLRKQKVIDSIEMLNQAMIAQNGIAGPEGTYDLHFSGIKVEAVVGDGDVLACSDLSLEILEVPGHSSCSIAVYIPEEKALFASDAGGIPFGDRIFTAANANFDLYQQSLEKMAAKDVDIHLAEHYGALSGEKGQQFLKKAIAAAAETRRSLEETYAETGDVAKTTQVLTDKIMGDAPVGFLPREVVAIVAGQMVNFIAKSKSPSA
jgi:glyoxylase-like metal-dependent hydrolase (beta-lactamase superfamily II)